MTDVLATTVVKNVRFENVALLLCELELCSLPVPRSLQVRCCGPDARCSSRVPHSHGWSSGGGGTHLSSSACAVAAVSELAWQGLLWGAGGKGGLLGVWSGSGCLAWGGCVVESSRAAEHGAEGRLCQGMGMGAEAAW